MTDRNPMSPSLPTGGAPRLDTHNINIDEDSAAEGECATLDLTNGWMCRQPAHHHDGCIFEPQTRPPE